MKSHSLGLPRIGARRELKFALEAFWKGTLTEQGLEASAKALRAENRKRQSDAGLDWITVGDFALYDQVLTNFLRYSGPRSLAGQFRLARGDAAAKPWDMTKWFDTNYHFLVPEIEGSTSWSGNGEDLLAEVDEALAEGCPAERLKAVVLGPVTLLALSKWKGAGNVWDALPAVASAFRRVLTALAARGVTWVQVDEPVLVLDADPGIGSALKAVYGLRDPRFPKILLTTYFGAADHQRVLIDGLAVDGVHLDLVRGPGQATDWDWPKDRVLSLGLVDGRNVWKTRDDQVPARLAGLPGGTDLWVSTSCPLLHVPVDLAFETGLSADLKDRLSFAVQKLDEVKTWAGRLAAGDLPSARTQPSAGSAPDLPPLKRQPAFEVRQALQAVSLNLPLWPTTTIGSFPQTADLRALRAAWKKGSLDAASYEVKLKEATARAVKWQDEAGLDVLVHGEFERNDMVEYFGEQLEGYAFTQNGWVQSYGSRCVKPPIIHADVDRPGPMTVGWISFTQSLTRKPVKGMLTGPVTMLQWAFVRDDKPRSEIAFQIARALEKEVLDLEAAGIKIIQVDEPAFREGLPLRKKDQESYWSWAIESFHYAVAGVKPETQIHTHMCYSDFSTCLPQIAALDADVITIETSRSAMALLGDFGAFSYPNAVGPGIWDIHSPRVPSRDEMVELLEKAGRVVPRERLWVNPDCGLKTRDWPEVEQSVANLVAAAREMRGR
jgi:5-methyltetrahydropteroyltriglutamate--homocysteine methyltransferase